MEQQRYLPDPNRLSVLSAMILLAYVLVPSISDQGHDFTLRIFEAVFTFHVDYSSLLSLLSGVLAALGMNWLLQSHPKKKKEIAAQHWILPALTAWMIGFPISTLEVSIQWWVVFGMGGLLLVLVLIAEYVVVDPKDMFHSLAASGLTAISFALYLFLSIATRAAGLRLYLLLPALVVTLGLVILRTLYLRLGGQWCWAWAAGIAFFVGQMAIGIHYLPVSPLAYGLILIGPAYALTGLAVDIEDRRSWKTIWIEPAIMWIVFWGMAAAF